MTSSASAPTIERDRAPVTVAASAERRRRRPRHGAGVAPPASSPPRRASRLDDGAVRSTRRCAPAIPACSRPATSPRRSTPPPGVGCGSNIGAMRSARARSPVARWPAPTPTGTPCPASGRRSASTRSSTSAWGDGFDEARFEGARRRLHGLVRARRRAIVGVLTHERDADYERGVELIARGAPWRSRRGRRRPRARRGGPDRRVPRALRAQTIVELRDDRRPRRLRRRHRGRVTRRTAERCGARRPRSSSGPGAGSGPARRLGHGPRRRAAPRRRPWPTA